MKVKKQKLLRGLFRMKSQSQLLAAEDKRLNEAIYVISKLPATGDGYVTYPGMRVWFDDIDRPGQFGDDLVPDLEMTDGPWELYYAEKPTDD